MSGETIEAREDFLCPMCGKPYSSIEEDFRGVRGICDEHGDFWLREDSDVESDSDA